jgi:hypothetical protein
MKTQTVLALVLLSISPVLAQSRFGEGYGSNGRHIGPYPGDGNPYQQRGGGIAPAFKQPDGTPITNVLPTTPPPLPPTPVWVQKQPDDGHSLQYQQYQQSQPQPQPVAPPVSPPVQPAQPQPQTQYMYNPTQGSVASGIPTAESTLYEEIAILKYNPSGRQFDYLDWYLKGAQIDPKTVLRDNAEWPEDAFRHFVADFLIAFWNVTMQDAFLRIVMPLLLVFLIFKTVDMTVQRLLR